MDIETTGFNPLEDEILQISILDAYSEVVLFDSLIRPSFLNSWQEAEAINKISPEMEKMRHISSMFFRI